MKAALAQRGINVVKASKPGLATIHSRPPAHAGSARAKKQR